ncbi:hypothetical protein M8494_31080 [Serratia ureilytica]
MALGRQCGGMALAAKFSSGLVADRGGQYVVRASPTRTACGRSCRSCCWCS